MRSRKIILRMVFNIEIIEVNNQDIVSVGVILYMRVVMMIGREIVVV